MKQITKTKLRKLNCILALGLVVIGVIITCFYANIFIKVRVKGPGILFEHDHYDAGEISEETACIVKHRFPFRNHGTEKLQIIDIKTSCGCVVVDKPEQKILSGHEGFLNVELTVGSLGKRSSDIVVYSNAVSSPDRLVIAATFKPKATAYANPTQLKFNEILLHNSTPESLSIYVFCEEPKPIKIELMQSQCGQTEINLIKTNTSQYQNQLGYYLTTFQLEVVPHPSNVGKFNDRLRISFQPSIVPNVEIPVGGRVVPKIVLQPHKVFFVSEQQNATMCSKYLFLYHTRNKSLSVVSVKNPFGDWLDISIEKVRESTKLKIILTPKQKIAGSIDGFLELIVQAIDETSEVVKIPISVRIF